MPVCKAEPRPTFPATRDLSRCAPTAAEQLAVDKRRLVAADKPGPVGHRSAAQKLTDKKNRPRVVNQKYGSALRNTRYCGRCSEGSDRRVWWRRLRGRL